MSERSTPRSTSASVGPNSERGPSAPAPKAPRAGKMSERSNQLRLLQSERPRPLRARKAAPRARRAVHWQDQWRLDSQTRRVGREGVASARAALARAHSEDLRRAS